MAAGQPEKIWKVKEGICNYEVFSRRQREQVTVKIVKLTEMQYGTAEILELAVDGEVVPTGESEHQILFVGDSLTAGYGVSGSADDLIFTTETEDVTKGYSYLGGGDTACGCVVCLLEWRRNYIPLDTAGGGDTAYGYPHAGGVREEQQRGACTGGDCGEPRDERCELHKRGCHEGGSFHGTLCCLCKKTGKAVPGCIHSAFIRTDGDNTDRSGKKSGGAVQERWSEVLIYRAPLSDKQDGYGTGEHPSAVTHKKTALVAARAIAQVTGWKE